MRTESNEPEYDVVMALNYYAPYVSGLTDAARLVAEALVDEGRRVLVVAGRHDPSLPREEVIAGVEVRRVPVIARIGKGLISPGFVGAVAAAARDARVINLHLPMIESGLIARRVRSTPIVVTYQCDVSLPEGWFNRLQTFVMDRSVRATMRRSAAIVPSSLDYAASSRLAGEMSDARTKAIAPPTRQRGRGVPRFRDGSGRHIGFLGRIVEEKGLEYLVDGFRALDDPSARLLIAGGLSSAGGSVVETVRAHIDGDPRIRMLGFLPDDDLDDFYASIDAFALPSVNAFEAFGIVQVEAMRSGVAAIASDLPGVRMPVRATGFGVIVRPRDSEAITHAIRAVQDLAIDPEEGARRTTARYSCEQTVAAYRDIFDSLNGVLA